MNAAVVKRTQEALGKVIRRPPLTEKLLNKPPFRYLHDIITEVGAAPGSGMGCGERVGLECAPGVRAQVGVRALVWVEVGAQVEVGARVWAAARIRAGVKVGPHGTGAARPAAQAVTMRPIR